MVARNFRRLLEARWDQDRFVCVGLDSDIDRLPEAVRRPRPEETIFDFNRQIVDATADLVSAYKPNAAFYEKAGSDGVAALARTVEYIHERAPDVPVILDAKRADIGSTNQGYVAAAFGYYQADAITVHPYLGEEALQPFLEQADKGILVLCRTSNPGAGEFQDLLVDGRGRDKSALYELVAERVAIRWNANGNCGLVVGATYPHELRKIREIVGDLPLLLPGVGAQGAEVAAAVEAGVDARGRGLIVNASRSIIFASSDANFAQAARQATLELHHQIDASRSRQPES